MMGKCKRVLSDFTDMMGKCKRVLSDFTDMMGKCNRVISVFPGMMGKCNRVLSDFTDMMDKCKRVLSDLNSLKFPFYAPTKWRHIGLPLSVRKSVPKIVSDLFLENYLSNPHQTLHICL